MVEGAGAGALWVGGSVSVTPEAVTRKKARRLPLLLLLPPLLLSAGGAGGRESCSCVWVGGKRGWIQAVRR